MFQNSKFSETIHALSTIHNTSYQAGGSKRPVQQDRRPFGTRSVQKVRERERCEERQVCEPEGDKGPRTPLAVFFNILLGERGEFGIVVVRIEHGNE